MAVCNGACNRRCHVKCMGYSSANFGDHKNWYCFRCQTKAAEKPYDYGVLEEVVKEKEVVKEEEVEEKDEEEVVVEEEKVVKEEEEEVVNTCKLSDSERTNRRKAREKCEKAAKLEQINAFHTLDQRDELTPGVVKKFASGEWDGNGITVQIVPIPIGSRDEPIEGQSEGGSGSDTREERKTKRETRIGITDGQYYTAVELDPRMMPMLKAYGGKLEELSLITICKCDYELRPRTKLLEKVPGNRRNWLTRWKAD